VETLLSVQSLSLVLLTLGIGLAFSRIRLSGWVLGWILLTGALLLQGFRSMLSYLSEHGGLDSAMYTVANDWMGLGFSLLIVASMYMMREVFAAHRLADEALSIVSATASDAIIMMDKLGTIAVWNEAAQRIFGYSAEEAQGKRLSELIVPERYRSDFEHGFNPPGSAARRPVTGKPMELAGLRKDGTEIITEYSLSRLSIDGICHVIYIVRDITERKRGEDEIHWLNQSLEHKVMERTRELKRSNEELEAFSNSVARDLRTPLRSINGFSAILTAEYAGGLDARAQDYLQRIRAATSRMGEVMDDLQALAYASRTELQQREVDLSAMAREVAASLRETAPERGVDFVIESGIRANADPGLIRIALDNLLGNAWKFTSKREHASIEFGRTISGGKPAYFLRDNGIGFDPAFSGKMFGQFQRLHSDTEYEGTGIGLAIVARVIRRHEGQIWAEGAIEQGATFYFTLAQNP
jgi:PAS domain S-box-containing protein